MLVSSAGISARSSVTRCSSASRDASLSALDPACAPGSLPLAADPSHKVGLLMLLLGLIKKVSDDLMLCQVYIPHLVVEAPGWLSITWL